MFGKRAPEMWEEMQLRLGQVDREFEAQDDLEVRLTMEKVRSDVLFESMPQEQYNLWQALFHSVKMNSPETMKRLYKNSGCNVNDLLDLLYIADQLAHHNPAVKLENQLFFRELFDLIKHFEGKDLDQVICENLGREFLPIERYLVQLVDTASIVRERVDYYVQVASLTKSIENPRLRYERTLDLQATIGAGIERVIELEEDDETAVPFHADEAHTYLLLLAELDMEFDKVNGYLIDAIVDVRVLYSYLQTLLNKLKKSQGNNGHTSGLHSTISKIVRKMHEPGLMLVINANLFELYTERLLALSCLNDTNQISDDVLIELMLGHNDPCHGPEQRLQQEKLRQMILKKGNLTGRSVMMSIYKHYTEPPSDWN